MFKLREYTSPIEKKTALHAIRNELLNLKKTIPVILEFEVGINISDSKAAFDLVINSSFSTMDYLKTYQVHPDHLAFIEFNKNYTVEKTVIDYEY